jgi:hypothetical protein
VPGIHRDIPYTISHVYICEKTFSVKLESLLVDGIRREPYKGQPVVGIKCYYSPNVNLDYYRDIANRYFPQCRILVIRKPRRYVPQLFIIR